MRAVISNFTSNMEHSSEDENTYNFFIMKNKCPENENTYDSFMNKE